jgi:hypothetical protein
MRPEDSHDKATISTPGSNLGRHVFGVAALALGLVTLAWHEYSGWHLSRYVVYPAAAAEMVGGVAIQFRRTAKMRGRPGCGLSSLHLTVCATNLRPTADLQ